METSGEFQALTEFPLSAKYEFGLFQNQSPFVG
jgi:hypothetical protein